MCAQLWPIDCSLSGSSVHRILRQEYRSGLPFPTAGDLPDPGIKPMYPVSHALAGRFFTSEPPGKPQTLQKVFLKITCTYDVKWKGKKKKNWTSAIHRGWDGWMASLTQWTWVWVNSGSWWWTGRPGVLRFVGLVRVGHDWATELMTDSHN